MRNIEAMLAAVCKRANWKCSNTNVEVFNDELSVILHGNYIYRIVDGVKWFTLAGWDTLTTRNRLRALGVDLKRKNGKTCYNGIEIDSNKWYNV